MLLKKSSCFLSSCVFLCASVLLLLSRYDTANEYITFVDDSSVNDNLVRLLFILFFYLKGHQT